MNDRIKAIAISAGFKDLPTVRLAFQGFDKELFVELIVKECCSAIADVSSGDYSSDDWDKGYEGGLTQAAETILERFGIQNE